ncbi:uncharacterized protein LOC116293891 [Actinia tenebrosa]|uniref:Uncharacterized protein LOC116293891 n=1 Tax=Actinia tenebrosa TaxID=6105 RepID=A0A6P8HQ75_ACTTE|nr:uncharacterized protein LOC116293891 [Actinia tenebrosa]
MRLRTLLSLTLLGIMIIKSLGVPIERELLRVKRKGEIDEENEEHLLQRRELKPLTRHKRDTVGEHKATEDETQNSRRRRFKSDQENIEEEGENYPNKMAARSSRSSREDKDVTAHGFDRFILPKDDIKGNKQPAKRSIAASGSGLESNFESSASGMWISDSAAKDLLSGKKDNKRSASSLESIVAALSAIKTDQTADFNGDNDGSASGAWVISGSGQEFNTPDDDLPKFFSAAASNSQYHEVGETISGSGSGHEENDVASKQGNLISDLAEEVHQDEKPSNKKEFTQSPAKPLNNETKSIKIHKRDILEQFFGENHKDVLSRSRREQDDKNVKEGFTSFFRNSPNKITSEADLPLIKHEPPPIPAVRSAKGGSKISQKSGSLETVNVGEGLTGLSLVRRFYRDQNMEQTGQTRKVLPKPEHILKDVEAKKYPITKKTEKKVISNHKVTKNNPFEARVVHTKQLPKAHVTIIEEPAVYTKNEEEGMDSSDGGMNEDESDESEPTIEIHERDIREDGYVGCFADQSPDRDLPFALSVRDLTPTTCRLACKKAQHAYAGLQYGYLCRCGDSYGKYTRLGEDQCSTACKGDGTQICGGFFRSSIYATDGVTEPTQGDFFHVESVRPLNAVINKPSSTTNYMPQETAYPSLVPYRKPNQFPYNDPVVQFAPSVQAPTYFSPDEPKVVIHSETPLPEYQAKPPPAVVKANVVNIPVQSLRYIPSVIGNMEQQQQQQYKKSTIARPPAPKVTPQGARVGKLHYLHQQHGVAPKPKPQFEPFSQLDITPGMKTFTGTIKLKQSWLDGLQNDQSPEFKILSGNIEQAFKKMFEKDPNFIKVKVLGFNKGLVKHNPATIRKVVAPFVLTFKKDTVGVENKVSKAIQDTGKLFDMPVYKKSIHIQEYHKAPRPSVTKDKIIARKEVKTETKRSSTTQPKVPYTLELFLMRDPTKIKRSTHPEKQ